MKQVLQDRNGRTVVRDGPGPACSPGSLLVRNAFSAISSGTERSRVALSQKSLLAKARARPDLVRQVVDRARREGVRATRDAVARRLGEETPVGYSSAGTVLEVGAHVVGFSPGDRVACAGGGYANHAQIVDVPANLCAAVPAEVSLEAASLTTIAAIAMHGIRLADVELGDRVAVIGCGLVGQIACSLLHAAGVEVFAVDIDESRIDEARSRGADHGFVADVDAPRLIRAATNGLGVDEVVVTAAAPSNEPLLLALEIARERGAVVLVGDIPVELPRSVLYDKELSFRVSRSYGPGRYDVNYEERGLDYPLGYVRWTERRNMEAVLDLQRRGSFDLSSLIDEIVPVDNAAEAYGRLVGPAGERPHGAILLAYPPDGEPPAASIAQRELALERSIRASGGGQVPVRAPIRVGLIGPGTFARAVLVPGFAAAGAILEVVGGGSGVSAEATARELGFARVAPNARSLIADDAVDAVVVATRHGSHADVAREALAAGKSVFCEKPLALTTTQLSDVLDEAARARAILAVGFNRRFSPLLGELRDFVRDDGSRVAAFYRVNAGTLDKEHWVHDLEQGGGRAIGEVCHFIDALVFLVGHPVVQVYTAGYGAAEAPIQARDNLAITLSFADGSVGTVTYTADGSPRVSKERLEVFSGGRAAILDDYRSLELSGPSGSVRRKGGRQDKGHNREIEAFVRGVEHGVAPVPLAEVANVSLATLAVVESLRTSQPVHVAEPQA